MQAAVAVQAGMLMTVTAVEFELSTGHATGRTLEFLSGSLTDGARAALYTARLKDGRAAMGSTGRVVYPHGIHGELVWVISRGEL